MNKFEQWENTLKSLKTSPEILEVYEEMKQEIIVLKEDRGMLEREIIETIAEIAIEKAGW